MKYAQSVASSHDPIWNGSPEPDVWWGEGGIDALIWPKPMPCAHPAASPTTPERRPYVQSHPPQLPTSANP